MRYFRYFAPAILVLWYFILGQRLVGTAWSGGAALLGWALLALPFASILWLPFVYWRSDRTATKRGHRLGLRLSYGSVGLTSLLFSVILLRDGAGLLTWGFAGSATAHSLYGPLPSAVVVALTAMLYGLGYLETRRPPRLRRVDIRIAKLPPEWHGVTVAQVTDLHVGHAIRRQYVERVVAILEAAAPDILVVTGDLADGRPETLGEELEPFRRLNPRDGAFYVTGNHEYYWGARAWVREAARLGWRPLENAHAVLKRGAAPLVVAGVNDYIGNFFPDGNAGDAARAVAGAPADAVRILLAHQPRFITEAAALGIDLQISGHTHGGQFIPWVFIVGFFNPVARGLRRFGRTWIYVSPGTGYWGPPIRVGAPAEVTLFRLSA